MATPISVLKMVELFEYAETTYRSGRYGSVHCFSDDVLEILKIGGRAIPDDAKFAMLHNARPGQFEFATMSDKQYTITTCSTGATVLRPGCGLEKMPFQIPYATISIQRAEREKGVSERTWSGLGSPVFAALWGRQDSKNPCDRNMCVAFYLENTEWAMAVDKFHHLGIWAKRYLCFGPKEATVQYG